MSFRSDEQLATVCKLLCARVGLRGMWTEVGPTDAALRMRTSTPWSHGEQLMFRASWALWNGTSSPDLSEMVSTLDGSSLEAIGSLLVALAQGNPSAVDGWIRDEQDIANRRASLAG